MGVDGITAPLPLEDLLDPGGMTCTPTLVPATLNTVPDVLPVIPACIAIV